MSASPAVPTIRPQTEVTPFENLATRDLPRSVSQERFTLLSITPQNIQEKQGKELAGIVRNQLLAWKNAAYTRLGLLRVKISNETGDHKQKLQEQLNHDLIIVDEGYSQLRNFVSMHLEELSSQKNNSRRIQVLSDSLGQVQGILSITIEVDHVFVHTLLSAPWNNLSMNSPLPSEYAPLVKRGVGKLLMAESFRIAHVFSKSRVELRPLADSESFYAHIGMEKRDPAYIMSTEGPLPEKLLVPGASITQGN